MTRKNLLLMAGFFLSAVIGGTIVKFADFETYAKAEKHQSQPPVLQSKEKSWIEGTKGWEQTGDSLYPVSTSTNVGIGTTSPTANLKVKGTVSIIRRVTEETYNTDTQYTAPTDILVIVTVSGGTLNATPLVADVTDGINYYFDYYGRTNKYVYDSHP